MTNLTTCEKLALEEVFDCLNDRHYMRFNFAKKRYFAYKMMKFYVVTKRLFFVRR